MSTLRACLSRIASAIALAALAGCGGGGSSPSPGATAPSPTPSPTPTVTPTPSPTYGLATDFSSDRDYVGWGVRLVSAYTAPSPGSPSGTVGTTRFDATLGQQETVVAGFAYAAATRNYTARWFGDTRVFGPAVSDVFDGFLPFDRVGQGDFYRIPFRSSPLARDYTRYAGAISWQIYTGNGNGALDSELREHFSVFGHATRGSDLPRSGTSTYQMVLGTRMAGLGTGYVIGSDQLPLVVNWTSGAVTGTWTIQAATSGVAPLSLAVTGQIDLDSNRLTGRISGSGFDGNLIGAAFGPQAQELAFAFSARNASNGFLVGTAGASR